MSNFLHSRHASLEAYTPGEQPRDMKYVKLNTNESPFSPSHKAQKMAAEAARNLQLYSDPTCRVLVDKLAEVYGVAPEEVIVTNGSDEVLDFAFQAFCGESTPARFPDITYGFYPVFAARNGVPYETVALRDDFTIDIEQYFDTGKTIFIANPNAPTGIALTCEEIERILIRNPDNVVVIDEAYVDFGGESCVPLIKKYDNLLVTQTFSKSRSLAGGRLGFGIGNRELIADLHTIRYSTNPYNVNSMTAAAGYGILCDEAYTRANCQTIIENRHYTTEALRELGFTVLDSRANFVFATTPAMSGEALYLSLKQNGVLVRHFENPRISDFIRISIGSRDQMKAFIRAVEKVLTEI